MVERCLQPIENVAVNAGGLTDNLKPRLLAELTSQVTDQSRKTAHAIGQWPHPAGQHFMMQPAGNVLAATRKLLDRLHRLAQTVQILGGLCLGWPVVRARPPGSVQPLIRQAIFKELQ